MKCKLSDVITDIAAGPFGSNLKVSCFVDDGFPIIDGANLKEYKVTDNITKFVTEEKARSLHRSIAKKGDVIVTISGTLGQIAFIPNDSKYEEYLCSQRQFRVTFDDTQIYVPYLVYYFHTYEGQHKILSFANQVGVPALSQPLKNFKQIEIDLPTLEIQKKIAAIIELINDKIELNNKINENLEQQAQAIFKSWFVDFEPFGGEMPDDWEIVSLENIIDFQNGYAFKSKELIGNEEPDTFRVFKQGHINKGGGFNSSGTKSWYKKSLCTNLEKYILHKGDILMAMTDMKDNVQILGNTAIMPVDNTYIINQRVGLLRSKNIYGIDFPFIYLLTNNENFLTDLRSRANSGVQVNLSSSEIKSSEVILAPTEINIEFNNIVKPMFEKILENSLENEKLSALRDALLPELMSGELDVSELNI